MTDTPNRQKITVELTYAQFNALSIAVRELEDAIIERENNDDNTISPYSKDCKLGSRFLDKAYNLFHAPKKRSRPSKIS